MAKNLREGELEMIHEKKAKKVTDAGCSERCLAQIDWGLLRGKEIRF